MLDGFKTIDMILNYGISGQKFRLILLREEITMARSNVIYETEELIHAKEMPRGEWIEYQAVIKIRDKGKQPVSIDMTFDSIQPFAIELPPTHKIRAENLTQAFVKVVKFFRRYGFEFK